LGEGNSSVAQPGVREAFQEFKITCSDRRNCVVVGTLRYSNESASTPTYAPAVLTEKAGRWGAPRPLGARVSAVGRVTEFLDVSCPSEGNCVAVGLGSVHGTYGSIEAVESNGRWSDAVDTFPADWTVLSVSCPAMRDCTVGGRISSPSGSEAFVSSGRVGQWSQPVQVGKAWTVDGTLGRQPTSFRVTVPRTVSSLASWTDRTLRGTEKSV